MGLTGTDTDKLNGTWTGPHNNPLLRGEEMQRIDGPRILFHCPQDLISRVDKIAAHTGTTRSETIRIMLETCCEGFEPFMKVGLLRKLVAKRGLLKEKLMSGIQPNLL